MRTRGACGARWETLVCARSDGGAGPPALRPGKARACAVSLCRSAPYWQIVILSCQGRLTSTYFRACGWAVVRAPGARACGAARAPESEHAAGLSSARPARGRAALRAPARQNFTACARASAASSASPADSTMLLGNSHADQCTVQLSEAPGKSTCIAPCCSTSISFGFAVPLVQS